MKNDELNEIKTPISVILDMAKNEIGGHVVMCMKKNEIPPSLMICVLNGILLDMHRMKDEQIAEEFVEIQKILNVRKNEDSENSQEG